MAFKNLPNQRYYLIAKHSGKALGFKNSSLGCQMTQMTVDPENENQKFTFAEGRHFYWIMPSKNERYLAVNNASSADEAELIQWHWEEGKANHQFHLDPAGDGYYRIRALHSNKFVDVIFGGTYDRTRVVQIGLSGTDNQLFKPVPVIGDPIGDSPMSFAEANEVLRTILLGVIGAIPKVGGIGAVIGFFWSPQNALADLWSQMKSYVDVRIYEILEQKQIEELRDDLTGILSNAKNFDGLSSGTAAKGAKLLSTITYAEGRRSHFFNKKASVLPYLVGLGTIMIALQHKLVSDYKEVFGHEPTPNDAQLHLDNLLGYIEKFTKEVAKHKTTLLKSRMAHIKDRHASQELAPVHIAQDTFDNWLLRFQPTGKHPDPALLAADDAVKQRRNQIQEQYEAELDEVMDQTKIWEYFDPSKTSKYEAKKIKRSVGSFGGIGDTVPFSGPEDSKITYITICHNEDTLFGFAIGYESNPEVIVGKASGNFSRLTLEKDEYITSIYGYTRHHIEGVWFTTQKGRAIGAGNKTNTPFSADLADSLNARLVSVSGSHNHQLVEKLTFHWEYIY